MARMNELLNLLSTPPEETQEFKSKLPRIVSAAIKGEDGIIYSLPAPARHPNVIHLMREKGYTLPIGRDDLQGFLTSEGNFIGREDAYRLVQQNGQCPEPKCLLNFIAKTCGENETWLSFISVQVEFSGEKNHGNL